MRISPRWSSVGAVAALGLLAACTDHAPGSSTSTASLGPRDILQAFICTGTVKTQTIACTSLDSTAAHANLLLTKGLRRNITVGGQGIYVQLTSSNPAYDGTQAFTFDVTIQNLIPQTMGTSDGVTPDTAGVRIFFQQDPVATSLADNSGSSAIAIANADGTGTFTSTNQAYYKYSGTDLGADGMLSTNETSGSKMWQLNIDPNVLTFQFTVYVNAAVVNEHGYVDVSPATSTMESGTGTALTGTVRSAVGDALSGQTIAWTSSDSTIATVDASGNVTAVAPGQATITATSGVRTGSATVDVAPVLNVGDSYVVSGPAAAQIFLSGSSSGTSFVVTPYNGDPVNGISMSITGSGIVAATGGPSPNLIPGGLPSLRNSLGVGANTGLPSSNGVSVNLEAALRLAEQSVVPSPSVARRAAINLSAKPSFGTRAIRLGGIRRSITPGVVPSVGDSLDLNVAPGCNGTLDLRRGVVVSVGQHAIVVADTANPANGLTTAQYDSTAAEFDNVAYEVDSANFGQPTDIDANGHTVIFFTRAVNELSPGSSTAYTFGYTAKRDLFQTADCNLSNAGEMIYMLVPDPTGLINNNAHQVSLVRPAASRTLVHQYQHIINAGRRLYVTLSPAFEEPWLDEGLSNIAMELAFYQNAGLSPGQNISGTDLTGPSNAARGAAFIAYANADFANLKPWLQRPDTSGIFRNPFYSTDSTDADVFVNNAAQGAMWAFLRYAADRQTGAQDAFWNALVNNNLVGVANIQAAIGTDPAPWFRDFVTALYTDDAVSGVSASYKMPSWDIRSVYGQLGGVPIGTRPLSNGVAVSLPFKSGSTIYARFGVPASGFATITTTAGSGAIPSNFSVVVVRTN